MIFFVFLIATEKTTTALADRELTVFHTLPPDFFAKFFKLKSEMCRDGIVEMDVDGVNFTCAQTEVRSGIRWVQTAFLSFGQPLILSRPCLSNSYQVTWWMMT